MTGAEGKACFPNDTCNAGLTCKNDRCVESAPGAGGAAGTGGSMKASSSTGKGGAGGAPNHSTGTGGTSGAGGATDAGGADSPPVILTFGTNVTTITPGQSVTFSAVVTDPDGIDDVIGGTLVDAGGGVYGAFASSGNDGAYQLSVSWDEFNQVKAIDFAYGATYQRTLTARFYDQAGESAEKNISITLSCNGDAACAGTCVNTMTSAGNCGSCGHACGNDTGCYGGKCGKLSGCLPKAASCSAACAAKGKVCKDLCGSGDFTEPFYPSSSCSGTASYLVACDDNLTNLGSSNYSEKCCCF